MKNNKAFTMAEVLITIGIVGIVSALTIPNLLNNIKAHQYRQRLKKTISTLSNSARLSQAQYGFDYSGINAKCGTNAQNEKPEETQSICAIFNSTLIGAKYYAQANYIPMVKKGENLNYSMTKGYYFTLNTARDIDKWRAYVLNDGTIIGFGINLGTNACSRNAGSQLEDIISDENNLLWNCGGFIDVNGVNLPNKEVSCSSGENLLSKNTCVVKNDTEHMTDIYPIRFHDGVVEPATAAARYVFQTAK